MDKTTKNLILGTVALLGFAYAGYAFFSGNKNVARALPEEYNAHGVCLNCKAESGYVAKLGASAPFKCSSCSEEALYPWMICTECQTRYVPNLLKVPGQPSRPNPFSVCPKCSCTTVAGWDPEFMTPAGDAPLPEWP